MVGWRAFVNTVASSAKPVFAPLKVRVPLELTKTLVYVVPRNGKMNPRGTDAESSSSRLRRVPRLVSEAATTTSKFPSSVVARDTEVTFPDWSVTLADMTVQAPISLKAGRMTHSWNVPSRSVPDRRAGAAATRIRSPEGLSSSTTHPAMPERSSDSSRVTVIGVGPPVKSIVSGLSDTPITVGAVVSTSGGSAVKGVSGS